MEADLKTLYYDAMIAFAASEGMAINVPNSDEMDKPATADAQYIDVAALPTTPQVLGVCNGFSKYVWTLQASIYVRDGTGDLIASEIIDRLRKKFPVPSKLVSANHTFTVMTPPHSRPPISMGGWHATPVQFRVQTIH